MSQVSIVLNVNGVAYPLMIEAHRTLLDVLRNDLTLLGTKARCLEGECGACTLLVDGLAVNSCLYLAVRANGKQIITVEGLAQEGKLHLLQQAFIEEGGVQCGYCTSGILMSARGLLDANPSPSEEEIVRALAGNLCRCTGYVNIRRALRMAAKRMAVDL